MNARKKSAKPRTTFRHGDLRRALLDAGVDLARDGGPAAVVLREATRRAGVVPNAAYRHFANQAELLAAVRSACIAKLAVAIEQQMAAIPRSRSAALTARRSLHAVGSAYLHFALGEPGLFRTAFSVPPDIEHPEPANTGPSGLNPFQLLGTALDRMVEARVMPAAERAGAEFLAWSTVHGMALLMLDGPLRGISKKQAEPLIERLLAMAEKGLA